MANTPIYPTTPTERRFEATRSAWDTANDDTKPYLLAHQEQETLTNLVKVCTKRRSLFARSLAHILRVFHAPEGRREAAILFLRALGNTWSEGCYGRDEFGGPDLDSLHRLNAAKLERYHKALVQLIGPDAVMAIDRDVETTQKTVELQLERRIEQRLESRIAEGSGASKPPR